MKKSKAEQSEKKIGFVKEEEIKDLVNSEIDYYVDKEKSTHKQIHINVSVDIIANESSINKYLKRSKVYLFVVIDISSSMSGPKIDAVKQS